MKSISLDLCGFVMNTKSRLESTHLDKEDDIFRLHILHKYLNVTSLYNVKTVIHTNGFKYFETRYDTVPELDMSMTYCVFTEDEMRSCFDNVFVPDSILLIKSRLCDLPLEQYSDILEMEKSDIKNIQKALRNKNDFNEYIFDLIGDHTYMDLVDEIIHNDPKYQLTMIHQVLFEEYMNSKGRRYDKEKEAMHHDMFKSPLTGRLYYIFWKSTLYGAVV